MNATQKKLAALVKRLRKRDLSDAKIASHIGVHKSTLSRWLSGKADPHATTASIAVIDRAARGAK